MAKIYNMGSQDFVVPTYRKKADGDITGANTIEKAIVIKGGAGVAFSDDDKVKRNQSYVVTEVTKDELEALNSNASFKRRVASGFISIDKVPSELKTDKSAQKTEKDANRKIETGKVDAE